MVLCVCVTLWDQVSLLILLVFQHFKSLYHFLLNILRSRSRTKTDISSDSTYVMTAGWCQLVCTYSKHSPFPPTGRPQQLSYYLQPVSCREVTASVAHLSPRWLSDGIEMSNLHKFCHKCRCSVIATNIFSPTWCSFHLQTHCPLE